MTPTDDSIRTSLTPAMEMLYTNVRENIIYSDKRELPLPKIDEGGRIRSNLLIMMTPSQDATFSELQKDYITWWRNGYKWYTSDTVFKGKIGRKRIFVNRTMQSRRKFDTTKFPHPLRYMTVHQRESKLKDRPNLILDMGEWTRLYFEYSFKVSIPVIVNKFMAFLSERLNEADYREYGRRIIYIPINRWFPRGKTLAFNRAGLDNPISILLFAMYRFPETLSALPENTVIFIADSELDQFVMYPSEFLNNRANFQKIKARMKMFRRLRWSDESEQNLNGSFSEAEMDEDSDINNTQISMQYADPRKVVPEPGPDATPEEIQKYRLMRLNRSKLINEAKRALTGVIPEEEVIPSQLSKIEPAEVDPLERDLAPRHPQAVIPITTRQDTPLAPSGAKALVGSGKKTPKVVVVNTDEGEKVIGQTVATTVTASDDVTEDTDVYDEADIPNDEDNEVPVIIDEEGNLDDQVEEAVDKELKRMQEEDPDVLLNRDGNLDSAAVQNAVQAQIRKSFIPEDTPEQKEKKKRLQSEQNKIIKKPTSAQRAKSSIIKETSLEGAIETNNEALKTAKYPNFDKCYNEQKLQSDIDNAVAILSKASSPIYVTSKTEEDTSDGLNLKKTITYNLTDSYGGSHVIKVDIPIIVDDNYIFINGSKIMLQHQLMLMPIVKTGPTDVQIISWYSKMTVRRMGSRDTRTDAIKMFMEQHADIFEIIPGNAMNRNMDNHVESTLDIDMYAKNFVSFTIGDSIFILDRLQLLDAIKKKFPNVTVKNDLDNFPVGFEKSSKEVIYVSGDVTLTDLIMERLSESEKAKIAKNTKQSARKILRSTIKVKDQFVPLVLLLCFYEGFEQVMKKAGILYHVITKDSNIVLDYDKHQFDRLELQDCFIIWERNPIWNTMLMNGFAGLGMDEFTLSEMEERETFANLLTRYYKNKYATMDLLQFYDFMIDPVTEEILEDFDYPTDLVSLLLLANRMLGDNSFTPINSAKAIRIRSNEVIAQMVYKEVTAAYKKFRATEYKAAAGGKRKPDRVTIKPNGPIKKLITESALSNEASDLNPILTMERKRAVTPKGPSGTNKDRAFTLQKRAYDKSMLGIAAITTPNDFKVGISRVLTFEPNITSVRGYVQVMETEEEVDSAKNINLLGPAELLSPPGVLHDDGPRIAMGNKQSQYMIPVDGACPVFFGNKVESALPYHLDREFTIVAKANGKVVEINEGVIIVQYSDGSYDAIDTNPKMKKNSSGFYVEMRLESSLTKVGQTFKKNEVIAYNPKAFTKNQNDLSASMNIGVPVKVAIMPSYDIYEDSAPISDAMSKKFTTHMSMSTGVGIPAQSYVEKVVNVGDTVEVGDPLIIYDPAHDDEGVNDFLNSVRSKLGEELIDVIDLAAMPQIRADHAGTIAAIECYTSVPIEELSPSLREMYLKFTEHNENVNQLLDKYKNSNDFNYYKCGQIIKGARDIVKPNYSNRVRGYVIGDDGRGVVVIFYINFTDIAKIGDKGSAYTALKFTTSHVTIDGLEAYSEYRPDEEISTLIAPGSVLARKTPSIWQTMAANKCLIEMTRHALGIFFDDTDGQPPDWKKK